MAGLVSDVNWSFTRASRPEFEVNAFNLAKKVS